MLFETRVQGIPCLAESLSQEEMIFRILDRNGRPAPWLERKLTEKDYDKIEDDFLLALSEEC
jgi:hypothetical protein